MNGNRSEGGSLPYDREPSPYVFAYGTLRRGARTPLLDFIGGGVKFMGRASAPGRLYDLGSYPAMLDPAEERERVFGELYELQEVEPALDRLDDYEGCGPNDSGRFRRCLRRVRLEGGDEVEAWTYIYQGGVGEGRRIASGDYFRRTG